MTKGSDLLVAALENEGVERIFGIPGEESRRRRVPARVGDRTGVDATRAGCGLHGRNLRAAHGKPGVCTPLSDLVH